MTIGKRVLCLLASLAAFSTGALADVTWTLNNVSFTDGTVATGSFTTNVALTGLDSYSVVVNKFTVSQAITTALPGEVGFANSGFSNYLDIAFASPLTNAGGVIPIVSSSITYGGNTYFTGDAGQGTISAEANVNGAPVPEPTSVLLLGTVASLVVFALRKTLRPTS